MLNLKAVFDFTLLINVISTNHSHLLMFLCLTGGQQHPLLWDRRWVALHALPELVHNLWPPEGTRWVQINLFLSHLMNIILLLTSNVQFIPWFLREKNWSWSSILYVNSAWMYIISIYLFIYFLSLGVMPKRGCNTERCEVMRFYKLHASKNLIEPLSMIVPRKVLLSRIQKNEYSTKNDFSCKIMQNVKHYAHSKLHN